MSELIVVDWLRRRVLRQGDGATARACHHGSRLTEWCGECGPELDVLAAELSA